MSSAQPPRKGGRGGGRSNGGRSLRGNNSNRKSPNEHGNQARQRNATGSSSMSDEDVLIAFMPFLKSSNTEAARIHEYYQDTNDQKAFVNAARDFLDRESNPTLQAPPPVSRPIGERVPSNPFADKASEQPSSIPLQMNKSLQLSATSQERNGAASTNHQSPLDNMLSIERGLDQLIDDDPVVPIPGASIWGSAAPGTPSRASWSNGADAATPPRSVPERQVSTASSDFNSLRPKSETKVKKEAPQPKRLWCHFSEQPGRLFVGGCSGENMNRTLYFGPREEVTAEWAIPIRYLQEYAQSKVGPQVGLDQLLSGLVVGLFRRGCVENGSQASIISKKVTGENNRSFKFYKDAATDSIRGQVPFFSPRTPGYVLFRLYWEDDPLHTLAMGPTLLVRVLERDFESSIRFVLSNFKGKKANPTSLSSLNSLVTVLETPLTRPNESASRATWGCLQEARKVIDACVEEYQKTSRQLSSLEQEVEELKALVGEDEIKSKDASGSVENGDDPLNEKLKEKIRVLMSGKASCERKWRDSQLAFASILKALVTNRTAATLLRRDMLMKLRLEYELWCPLSEEFAKVDDSHNVWYEAIRMLPPSVSQDHFRAFSQARVKMQVQNLGFEPKMTSLEDILYPLDRSSGQRSVDTSAIAVFNKLSASMGQYFQKLFANENEVRIRREAIRARTEQIVQSSEAFPPGTRVAIFGSSANGFGSPNSDIDMCLQLPPDKASMEEDDGYTAMSKLSDRLTDLGMKEVDTSRLTARIPIIMYRCPDPFSPDPDNADTIDCDLSMHNPLAVLNTALLRSYAELTPVTRVLASIIKKWAKARDINNPAKHTLSSYGYIIMLLHFLTHHKRTGNGLVSSRMSDSSPTESGDSRPLLPNLQWMDPTWLSSPQTMRYIELAQQPKEMMKHPREEKKYVNSYFFKARSQQELSVMQMAFAGQDLSLAILLTSFFRYFAYEFDYKRFVVSLHSTPGTGMVEREVKAELDGWRNYSAALTVEDPFETFYDVAHVLRGGYYHRIRREFAMAYSKLADVASGNSGAWDKGSLQDMSGDDILEWLCEPVVNEKDEPEE